jgi:hypothetical protein
MMLLNFHIDDIPVFFLHALVFLLEIFLVLAEGINPFIKKADSPSQWPLRHFKKLLLA